MKRVSVGRMVATSMIFKNIAKSLGRYVDGEDRDITEARKICWIVRDCMAWASGHTTENAEYFETWVLEQIATVESTSFVVRGEKTGKEIDMISAFAQGVWPK